MMSNVHVFLTLAPPASAPASVHPMMTQLGTVPWDESRHDFEQTVMLGRLTEELTPFSVEVAEILEAEAKRLRARADGVDLADEVERDSDEPSEREEIVYLSIRSASTGLEVVGGEIARVVTPRETFSDSAEALALGVAPLSAVRASEAILQALTEHIARSQGHLVDAKRSRAELGLEA